MAKETSTMSKFYNDVTEIVGRTPLGPVGYGVFRFR